MKCPECEGEELRISQYGGSLYGMTCLNCGHRWKEETDDVLDEE